MKVCRDAMVYCDCYPNFESCFDMIKDFDNVTGHRALFSTWILIMTVTPNQSPEPTAVGAFRSAVAVHVAGRRWLSFFR